MKSDLKNSTTKAKLLAVLAHPDDETFGMGMPLFKGFPVEVKAAPNESVLTLDELLMKEYGR